MRSFAFKGLKEMSTTTNAPAQTAASTTVTATPAAAPKATTAQPKTAPAPKKTIVRKASATGAAFKTTAKAPAAPADSHVTMKTTASVASPKKDSAFTTESSFENKKADNPLASGRKTLEEKIRERVEFVEKRDAAAGKKTAVAKVEDARAPEDIQDAGGFAGPRTTQERNKSEIQEKQRLAREKRIQEATQESTEVEAAAPNETPQESEFESLPGTAAELNEPVEDAGGVTDPAWEPNFNFKFQKFDANNKDLGVESEAEIPEEFRGLITDAESEKKVRELFSKAHGIDFVKEMRNVRTRERDEAYGHIGQIHKRLAGVDESIKRGDLDTAFETMQIPQEKVLHWVLDKINYSQLDPGQRQLIDSQRDTEKRLRMTEQQNHAVLQNTMQSLVKAKTMALDAMLDRSDLKTVISAYDNRQGKKPTDPSFRDLVINHGELTWHRSGGKQELSPHEAIEAVLQNYGIAAAFGQSTTVGDAPPAPRQQQNAAAPAPRTAAAPQQRQAPTLPSVPGRAASPTAPKIKTKADLLAHRKQKYGF